MLKTIGECSFCTSCVPEWIERGLIGKGLWPGARGLEWLFTACFPALPTACSDPLVKAPVSEDNLLAAINFASKLWTGGSVRRQECHLCQTSAPRLCAKWCCIEQSLVSLGWTTALGEIPSEDHKGEKPICTSVFLSGHNEYNVICRHTASRTNVYIVPSFGALQGAPAKT